MSIHPAAPQIIPFPCIRPATHLTLQFLPAHDQNHLLQKLLKLSYCPASLEKPQAAIGTSWPQHELLYLHSLLLFSPLASTSWLKPAQSQTKPKEQKKDTSLLLNGAKASPAASRPDWSQAQAGSLGICSPVVLPRLLSCCWGGHKSRADRSTPSP